MTGGNPPDKDQTFHPNSTPRLNHRTHEEFFMPERERERETAFVLFQERRLPIFIKTRIRDCNPQEDFRFKTNSDKHLKKDGRTIE